jgi:hypothetical protein
MNDSHWAFGMSDGDAVILGIWGMFCFVFCVGILLWSALQDRRKL